MLTKKTIEPVLGGEEDWQKAETVDGERGWGEDGSDAQEPLVTLEVAKTRASSKLKPDLCLKHATSRTAAITPQTNPGASCLTNFHITSLFRHSVHALRPLLIVPVHSFAEFPTTGGRHIVHSRKADFLITIRLQLRASHHVPMARAVQPPSIVPVQDSVLKPLWDRNKPYYLWHNHTLYGMTITLYSFTGHTRLSYTPLELSYPQHTVCCPSCCHPQASIFVLCAQTYSRPNSSPTSPFLPFSHLMQASASRHVCAQTDSTLNKSLDLSYPHRVLSLLQAPAKPQSLCSN